MFTHLKVFFSPKVAYDRKQFKFLPCYVSGSMQIQLNNLLISISKSSFAIEFHPIPSRVISPTSPCALLYTLIQHGVMRMISKPK